MKHTVSIGIPAYNEEQNIKRLLITLLSQRTSLVEIKEILVVNDCSTDATAQEVHSIADPRIRLIAQQIRSGLAMGQNIIAREATGDFLVLLDADVVPTDSYFLDEICKPLIDDASIGLVGGNVIAAPGKTFFEKVLVTSHELKTSIYTKINNGNTIYLCHGRARAFSRALYSIIEWPNKFAEDQYSYLFARDKGFGFTYAEKASVMFRSPARIIDHFRQSLRFIGGHKMIIREFDEQSVAREYAIPVGIVVRAIAEFIFWKPLHVLVYLVTLGVTRVLGYFFQLKNQSSYEPSPSSKKVV